jgi:hypothetical protein
MYKQTLFHHHNSFTKQTQPESSKYELWWEEEEESRLIRTHAYLAAIEGKTQCLQPT